MYLSPRKSPLAFWYETPEVNERAFSEGVGEYYMTFRGKAEYAGPFDETGIPLLDYRGDIGRQYNPIAIAQYGLASYNCYKQAPDSARRATFLRVADWLVQHLEENPWGLRVWHHNFDWPYRVTLVAPWYSGLAQGQGISLLIRAALDTGRTEYGQAAVAAFSSFTVDVKKGGVVVRDPQGFLWVEEYLVEPPSHILNGFIWALWGIYDFARWSGDPRAQEVLTESIETLAKNLPRYDTSSWSLYELSDTGPRMLASPYYHRLHVVQLKVLYRLTGREVFARFADRWEGYARNPALRTWALARKAWFKLRHY